MDTLAITIGLSSTLTGLLIIGLAIPLIRQRVGRNRFYGIRLPESYKSDDAWFAINRYGGRRLMIWAIPLVLIGVVTFALPLHAHPWLTIAIALVPLVCVIAPTCETWWFARHYH